MFKFAIGLDGQVYFDEPGLFAKEFSLSAADCKIGEPALQALGFLDKWQIKEICHIIRELNLAIDKVASLGNRPK